MSVAPANVSTTSFPWMMPSSVVFCFILSKTHARSGRGIGAGASTWHASKLIPGAVLRPDKRLARVHTWPHFADAPQAKLNNPGSLHSGHYCAAMMHQHFELKQHLQPCVWHSESRYIAAQARGSSALFWCSDICAVTALRLQLC